jgi:enamine deaminase RidA (YjgF/YER057c/UK114 family)
VGELQPRRRGAGRRADALHRGINGYDEHGELPQDFEAQAENTWRHIDTLLTKAGMTYQDLVAVRTYLGHPDYDESVHRRRYLRDHRPAVTVVSCQLVR